MPANPLETIDAADVDAVLSAARAAFCAHLRAGETPPHTDLLLQDAAAHTGSEMDLAALACVSHDLAALAGAIYGFTYDSLAPMQQFELLCELQGRVSRLLGRAA